MMTAIIVFIGLIITYVAYCILCIGWCTRNSLGLSYYGKPLAERIEFKKKVALLHKSIVPFLKLLNLIPKPKNPPFAPVYKGVVFPWFLCSEDSLEKAEQFEPRANDIIIATQQRSGTTWAQQLIYEILCRGKGDLSDHGHNHLYAVSPWLEALIGVPVEQAPIIGEQKRRIIKTHLPAFLCPYRENTRYIYIARHPASCCASCIDWYNYIAGPFVPEKNVEVDFFCSDNFFFSPWPKHVEGYWQWSHSRPNVLFLHFEELKADLPGVIRRIADFLNMQLSENEVALISGKCSFDYMSKHAYWFEMSPPTPFMPGEDGFFKSGSSQRFSSLEKSHREKIIDYCKTQLKEASYPIARFYPE